MGDHWSPAFCVCHPMFTGGQWPPLQGGSKVCNLAGLQLKLQFVSDQGDELRIRGFSLGIGNRVPEEALQSVQIASVPCYLNGMSNCTFHSGRRGLEGFRHLGGEYLGDGIDDIHVVDGDGFIGMFVALMLSCLLSCSNYSRIGKAVQGLYDGD